jgi:hypothetical protein
MATKFLSRLNKPVVVQGPVITITTARRLKASETGAAVHFNSATSLTATLPAPQPGLEFTFFVKAASGSGTGHFVDLNGTTEKLFAKGITAAGGKGIVNTQATGAIGDAFSVWSDGTDWFGVSEAGTWAREA